MSAPMTRKEFEKIMSSAAPPTNKPRQGEADWEMIITALQKLHKDPKSMPLTISQIQEHYVKNVVTRHRTKNKLHELTKQGKCLRLYDRGKYFFVFATPEGSGKEKQ